MKKENAVWGLLLIILGVLFFFCNLFGFRWGGLTLFWPFFLLIPGLIFELAYFSTRKNPGFLVPGGILIILGLLFFFEALTHWHFAGYTWPIYPFAAAFGLFQLYLFDGQPRALLVPIFILLAIPIVAYSIIFFTALASWVNLGLVIPVILIGIGVLLLLKDWIKK